MRTRDLGGTGDARREFTAGGLRGDRSREREHGVPREIAALDDITRAVLARDEVVGLSATAATASPARAAEQRVHEYLEELRTRQRYPIYRALKHPLYPILRKIDAHHRARSRSCSRPRRAGRVVYVSNHRSHIDYLIEPLVLEDNGIRPPIIAAGINLFGGPLGLIHRHVTGAIPIRRNTQGPGLPDHAQGVRRRDPAAATT